MKQFNESYLKSRFFLFDREMCFATVFRNTIELIFFFSFIWCLCGFFLLLLLNFMWVVAIMVFRIRIKKKILLHTLYEMECRRCHSGKRIAPLNLWSIVHLSPGEQHTNNLFLVCLRFSFSPSFNYWTLVIFTNNEFMDPNTNWIELKLEINSSQGNMDDMASLAEAASTDSWEGELLHREQSERACFFW